MATFQLLIANLFTFGVLLLLDSGAKQPIKLGFDLTAKRLTAAEFRAAFGPDSKTLSRDFLLDNITGWHGQTLIGGEDGKPAPFSRQALAAMLDVPGVETKLIAAYIKAMEVTDSEDGRAKN